MIVISDFPTSPSLKKYLSSDSQIVKSKLFESAVVKIQNNAESALTIEESDEVKHLLRKETLEIVEQVQNSDYATQILKDLRTPKAQSKYINLNFLVPTSVAVERFFSIAGYVAGERRLAILPTNLEEQLFLMINRHLWSPKYLMDFYERMEKGKAASACDEKNDEDNDMDDPVGDIVCNSDLINNSNVIVLDD